MNLGHSVRITRVTRRAIFLLVMFLTLWPGTALARPADAGPRNEVAGPRPDSPMVGPSWMPGETETSVVKSVHVQHLFDLAVVQQPEGEDAYIADVAYQATQFSLAREFGSIGLLAHNGLGGRWFSQLAPGETVLLAYTDGRTEDFVVTRVLRYQAVVPEDPATPLKDLATNEILSGEQAFAQAYGGQRHLVFQTCIYRAGDWSWGRLFVIAAPVPTEAGAPRERGRG
jgi:hypothetical protein